MKKEWIVGLMIFIAVILLTVFASFFLGDKSSPASGGSGGSGVSVPPIPITYDNMEAMLSKNAIVGALPEGSVIFLRFYNFNTGEREWERSFIMKRGEVKEGYFEKADITMILHSKYLAQLTDRNFCSVIKSAKANGDLGTETELSTTKLLWKFRSIRQYRDCLGF